MQMKYWVHVNNKTEAAMTKKLSNEKNQEFQEAVQYCMKNNVRGYQALQTDFFPLIKDRETINLGLIEK